MPDPKFSYKFTGDTPKIFKGKLIRPGDAIASDDELINGEFEPTNAAAKSAQKATEAADLARSDEHVAALKASGDGPPLEAPEPVVGAAAAPAAADAKPAATKSAAAAATGV